MMTPKTKLAIVVDTCHAGGVSKALNDFIKCIDIETIEITLFVKNFSTVTDFDLPDDITCQEWPDKYSFGEGIKTEGFFSFCNYKTLDLRNRRNFGKRRVYRARQYKKVEENFDCVIGYQMIANEVTIVTLEKIPAKRRILWLHGKKNFKDSDLKFYDDIYSRADLIVSVSKDTEIRFKKLMPKCADKTITIHNFYDFDTIYSKADEPFDINKVDDETVIVSTGRLSKEKGFDRVPEVTKKLVDDGYNIKWYIAGDGDKRESIAADITEKGLKDHVILTGFITNPYPYVKQCDIYVQPSYTEGFCTSTMEAKILRRPVVTTDVPGMKEQFVNEYDGLIVESSVDGLYQGIKRIIDDKVLYQSIIDHLNNETFSNDEEVKKALKAITG